MANDGNPRGGVSCNNWPLQFDITPIGETGVRYRENGKRNAMWRGAVLTVGLAWASVPLQAQEEVPNHFIVLLNDEEIEETGFLGDLIEELACPVPEGRVRRVIAWECSLSGVLP